MERDGGEDDEDHEGDDFLDDLELHEVERSSVALETDAVGGYLQAVLEERNAPGEEDDEDQRGGAGEEAGLLQLKMAVPGECHEDIRCH